jgi:hypothetical protein
VNWISRALGKAEQLPKREGEGERGSMRVRLQAWHGIAFLAYLNDNPVALKASEAGVALARALGDQRMLVLNLAIEGWERMALQDNPGALKALEESLSIGRSSGDRYATGIALAAMASYALSVAKDLEASRRYEAESLKLLADEQFTWGAVHALVFPLRGAMMRGDYAEARARSAKLLTVFEQMGDEHRVNMVRSWMAHVQRHEGHIQEAAAGYRKTIVLWQKLGHRGAIAHQLESFAFVAKALEQPPRAARLFGAAEALREKIAMPMDPEERVEYDEHVEALRGRMDANALEAAWSEGRKMTMEQAITYALSEAEGKTRQ